MTVQAATSGGARCRVPYASVFLFLLVLTAGCSDLALFSPQSGSTRIALRPYFSYAINSAVDVNFIRVTAKKLPNGPAVEKTQTVDPNATDWPFDLELDANSEYEVTIVLINKSPTGETIVSSGKIESLRVTSGPQPVQQKVPTFPGGPENLSVTSVTITPRDQGMLEGDQLTVKATVGGVQNPTVTWLSSNGAVATVDPNGMITAKAPGTTEITAQVASKSDKITVQVGAKATSVEFAPPSVTLTSIGADATFTGRVIDVRNATVPGLTFSCSITDATIATQVAPCVFRARKNGTTNVTAKATQNGRDVTGTATLKVEQKAINVVITPGGATFDAFGAMQQFTASAKDANGNDVIGLAFTWSSTDATIASVDAAGLVTAKGNGTVQIKVDAAGAAGQVPVTVAQKAATITLSPGSATLRSINEKLQLNAEVKDARGNPMNTPITWSSTIPGIVEVSSTGLATAHDDGIVVITAAVGGQRAFSTIAVSRTVASVRLSDTNVTLDAGNSKQLTATPVDGNGFAINDVPVTWATNRSAVAIVSNTGLVTGLSAGTAEITAKAGNGFGVATFTVKGTLSGNLRVNSNGKVLLINADGGNGSFVKSSLISAGFFAADKLDELVMNTPPALSALTGYGAVLVWTNYPPPNPAGWGDLLKQYVDAGGKVVLAVYSYSNLSDPWDIEGGIMSAGYSPLVNTNNRYVEMPYVGFTLNFTTALTAHPILAGVSEFVYGGNSNYVKVTAAPGATIVARDANGIPLIGVSASGAVVGFNLYPGNAFPKSAGVWKALTNALK